MHSKVNILGVQVSSLTNEELLNTITNTIISKQFSQIAITPTNSIVAAYKEKGISEMYNKAEIVLCDGMPVKWASHFLGTPIKERITGLDVLPNLVKLSSEKNFSLFLLGASPGVGHQLAKVITEKYPNITIAGIYVPPFMNVFSEEENQKMINEVNASSADIVLVSLTAPKQDIWIAQNRSTLNPAVYIGIGGAFEVMAGLARRSPKWMQNAGLEWFYRFIQEPKRLFRRYFIEAPVFIPLVIKQKFGLLKRYID
jgi:N-acetylglucosaminyldiphosphoundecaprenol N-acetyl-beta-D-mannosaminyltransferase